MLDPKLLRNSLSEVEAALKKRSFEADLVSWKKLEKARKGLQADTEKMKATLNVISKEIGKLKTAKKSTLNKEKEASNLTKDIKKKSPELDSILGELSNFNLGLPNIPDPDVPLGNSEEDNLEIKNWGKIPEFSFQPKDHIEIGQLTGGIDMEAGSRITGSRFYVLKSDIASLHRSLIQFMLDLHIKDHGYEELYVPYIVNSDSLKGTGQLPKFEEDLFKIESKEDYYLTSTAEVPVTNMLRNQIIDSKDLPIKWVSHTPCFRSEAGSYGKDTRGIMRLHQFEKVELVHIVKPDESYEALEELTKNAESILQKLKLPYRLMLLCSGDTGFSAAKTYDLEVWLPSQETYREISSCSNCESFQSRRMKARYKNSKSKQTDYPHTLNGSGLAIGRTLIAVLENYQNEDGTVTIPDVLRPYMQNRERI